MLSTNNVLLSWWVLGSFREHSTVNPRVTSGLQDTQLSVSQGTSRSIQLHGYGLEGLGSIAGSGFGHHVQTQASTKSVQVTARAGMWSWNWRSPPSSDGAAIGITTPPQKCRNAVVFNYVPGYFNFTSNDVIRAFPENVKRIARLRRNSPRLSVLSCQRKIIWKVRVSTISAYSYWKFSRI
jgi:hypothetical protein